MRNNTNQTEKKKKYDSPMDAALRFLGARARSVREVERHLDELNFGEVEIYDTVERLKELSLLGDEAYAREFIDSRLRSKPVSRAHLREQLRLHEVDADCIDDAVSEISDETERDNALRTARSFVPKDGIGEDENLYNRILARIMRHGFGYHDSRRALDQSIAEWNEANGEEER